MGNTSLCIQLFLMKLFKLFGNFGIVLKYSSTATSNITMFELLLSIHNTIMYVFMCILGTDYSVNL